MSLFTRALMGLFGRALMRCDESARLFSEQRERRLTCRERLALSLHPILCPPCRAHVSRSRRMVALLRREADMTGTPPVPEEVRRRLEERVIRVLEQRP